jgi:carbon monoxide dehydrogenase subunit G
MAKRFEATVLVKRPIEQVFDFLADGENDKKFSSRVLAIAKTTEGPPAVGTVFASTVKDAGVKTKREFELVEFERPTKLRWRELSKAPVVVPSGGYDLESEGEGTRVTLFNELEGRGFGKLIVGFALRSARKSADDMVASIGAAVEAS